MFKEGFYENLGNNLFNEMEDYRKSYKSLATISQISLLMGLISDYKFSNGKKIEKVVEVGVYHGVTSLFMLKTGCKISNNFKLYGIDIDPSTFCGDAVIQEANEEELKAYSLHRGKTVLDISEIIDKNEKIDLAFLDGGHSHPFPLINLVSVIPYLHEESLICLHDVVDHMQPNEWGESFLFERWPQPKYRDINKLGKSGTLGIVQLPKDKNDLYKMLLDIAKIPLRASVFYHNGKHIGVTEETFVKLKSFMLKHYDTAFVEDFINALNNNLKKYHEECILRIHETRFYKHLYDQIKDLKCSVKNLEREINTLKQEKQVSLGNSNLLKILKDNCDKKVLLWGSSLYLEKFLKHNNLSDFNIIGIIDINAKDKSELMNYKLYTPEEIKDLDADLIISTVFNSSEKAYNDIKFYLNKNNISIDLAPNIFA